MSPMTNPNSEALRKIHDDIRKCCESYAFSFDRKVESEVVNGVVALMRNDETGEEQWMLEKITTSSGTVIDVFEHPGWSKVTIQMTTIELETIPATAPQFSPADLNWRPFYQRTKDGYGVTMCAVAGAMYDDDKDITRNIEWIECRAGRITTNEYMIKCRGLGKLVDLSKADDSTDKRICITFFIIDEKDRTAYCSMLRLEPHSYDITSDGTYMIGIGSVTSLPMNYDLMLSIYNMRKTGGNNHAE